jgi:hypothetical protein
MKHRKSVAPPLAIATFASAVLIVTSFGTYAALTAEVSNEPAQSVATGTLSLKLTNEGLGFTQNVAGLAPGDTVNRYVTLENDGTLEGNTLTLALAVVAPSGSESLVTNAQAPATSQAITLAISSCPGAWDTATGDCDGTPVVLRSASPLSDFSNPIDLGSGSFAPEAVKNLQVSLTLPDQSETTVNGIPPAAGIQGKTVNITYTFRVLQRDLTVTNG